ncbi:M56 family metallopeptidase [Stieleria varia]|uniref:Regulatory protein BlaR1 n=1 Tax=Stieleria varia TaxID=2528005 RepID=A0A5C6AMB2_9BACT|nr:M56 family metallopeptidase [Stieleria varia]TWU01155.1 Regulatory protein BlaR1 [Stieleria varia]
MFDFLYENQAYAWWIAKLSLVLFTVPLFAFLLRNINPRWRVWAYRVVAIAIIALTLATLFPPINQLSLAWMEPDRDTPNTVESVDRNLTSVADAANEVESVKPQRRAPASTRSMYDLPAFDEKGFTLHESPSAEEGLGNDVVSAGSDALENQPVINERPGVLALPSIGWIVFSLWILGLFIESFRWILGVSRARRLIRVSRPADAETIALMRDLCEQLGVRLPRLLTTELVDSPCVVGTIRPTILLRETHESPDLRFELAHELGHIAGADLSWDAVMRLLRCVFWPHPLVWFLRSSHRIACEMVCDLAVADAFQDREGYSRTLARAALTVSHRRSVAADGFAMARTPNVMKRLRMIGSGIHAKPLGKAYGLLAFAILMIAVFVGLTGIAIVPRIIAQEPNHANLSINVRVVSTSDQPLSDARVEMTLSHNAMTRTIIAITNGDGLAEFSIERPATKYSVLGAVYCNDHVPEAIPRVEYAPDQQPQQMVVRLARGALVGGTVQDEQGKPIADAKISILKIQPGSSFIQTFFNERSAADGTWLIDAAPDDARISIRHDDFIDQTFAVTPGTEGEYILERGRTIRGIVRNKKGEAVAGATVGFQAKGRGSIPHVLTDEEGRFHQNALPNQAITVYAFDAEHVKQKQFVELTQHDQEVEFKLLPGRRVAIHTSDQRGNPIVGAWVRVHENAVLGGTLWTGATDNAGVFRWSGAGSDPLQVSIGANGFRSTEMIAEPEVPLTVTLNEVAHLKATVTDEQTGKPIDQFTAKIVDANLHDDVVRRSDAMVIARRGRLEFELRFEIEKPVLVVESAGYQTWRQPFDPNELQHSFDIKLARVVAEPTNTIRARLLDPNGKLAAGAKVVLIDPSTADPFNALSRGGRTVGGFETLETRTDNRGRLEFITKTPLPANATLGIEHDSGYAQVLVADLPKEKIIRLRPWAQLKVSVLANGKPVSGAEVSLSHEWRAYAPSSLLQSNRRQQTNENGEATFNRVVPGSVSIKISNDGKRSHQAGFVSTERSFEIKDGFNELVVKESGIRLVGRVILGPDPQGLRQPTFDAPGMLQSDSGLTQFKANDDGSFIVEHLPAGTYSIRLPVMAKVPKGHSGNGRVIDTINQTFELKNDDAPQREMQFNLSWNRIPTTGDDALPFVSLTPDGKVISSKEYSGKWLLLDFFPSQSELYQQQLTRLRAMHAHWNSKGVAFLSVAILGHVSGDIVGNWSSLDWPIVGSQFTKDRILSDYEAGTAPTRLLINPQGKIVYRGSDLDELNKVLTSLVTDASTASGIDFSSGPLNGAESVPSQEAFQGDADAMMARIESQTKPQDPHPRQARQMAYSLSFYRKDGSLLRSISLTDFTTPRFSSGHKIAMDHDRQMVFVVASDAVLAFNRRAELQFRTPLPHVEHLAINQRTGDLWCASGFQTTGVTVILDKNGNERRRIPYAAKRMDYSERDDAMFVWHDKPFTPNATLVKLNAEGTELSHRLITPVPFRIEGLVFDKNGNVWFVVADIPDQGAGLRFSLCRCDDRGIHRLRTMKYSNDPSKPPKEQMVGLQFVGDSLWLEMIQFPDTPDQKPRTRIELVASDGGIVREFESNTQGGLLQSGESMFSISGVAFQELDLDGNVIRSIPLQPPGPTDLQGMSLWSARPIVVFDD